MLVGMMQLHIVNGKEGDLPTEAEYEYAMKIRKFDNTIYTWGNEPVGL